MNKTDRQPTESENNGKYMVLTRNIEGLIEAEENTERGQEYTEPYKKGLNDWVTWRIPVSCSLIHCQTLCSVKSSGP